MSLLSTMKTHTSQTAVARFTVYLKNTGLRVSQERVALVEEMCNRADHFNLSTYSQTTQQKS